MSLQHAGKVQIRAKRRGIKPQYVPALKDEEMYDSRTSSEQQGRTPEGAADPTVCNTAVDGDTIVGEGLRCNAEGETEDVEMVTKEEGGQEQSAPGSSIEPSGDRESHTRSCAQRSPCSPRLSR